MWVLFSKWKYDEILSVFSLLYAWAEWIIGFIRGLTPFTKECRPVKLFAKHLKVEEQVLVFYFLSYEILSIAISHVHCKPMSCISARFQFSEHFFTC
jgi:hypothetical protein